MLFKIQPTTIQPRRVLRRFAIWPTHIGYHSDGSKLYVWLDWYLVKVRHVGALRTHSFRPVSSIPEGFVPRLLELNFY